MYKPALGGSSHEWQNFAIDILLSFDGDDPQTETQTFVVKIDARSYEIFLLLFHIALCLKWENKVPLEIKFSYLSLNWAIFIFSLKVDAL